MKLKPIVASVLVAVSGLAGTAALAASAQSDAMQASLARLQAIVEQNQPGGFQQSDGWWNRITLSGEMNIDANESSAGTTLTGGGRLATNPVNPYVTGSTGTIFINNANLFVDSAISDYTKVHVDIAGDSGKKLTDTPDLHMNAFGDARQTNSMIGINTAYAILGNFNQYPVFAMVGKQYMPFGEYNVYPMVYSLTQLMSQTNNVAVNLGWIDCPTGIFANAFGFQDKHKSSNSGRMQYNNAGARLGIRNNSDCLGYNVSVDWLYNLNSVQWLDNRTTYVTNIGGLAANGDFTTGPFDAGIRYVGALQNFGRADVPYYVNGTLQRNGAEPWAGTVNLGYAFPVMCHQSHLGVSYQLSKQAAGFGEFGMPMNRYEANYVVNISRFTDLGLDVYYDQDYGTGQGGSGNNATTGVVRLGVKFA